MRFDALIHRPASLSIDGGWQAATGVERLSVVDPSTGRPFAEITCASAVDVGAAVGAAVAACPGGARRTGTKRAVWLRRFAQGLKARVADLVTLQMTNNGKPRAEAETDLADAIATVA